MVEMLAAGLTGGTNSVDVKPLKAPQGAPHDLGQFYILIDPGCSPDYADRLARLAGAVADDPGARIPGANTQPRDNVDVPDALWAQLVTLSDGPNSVR